MKTISHVSVFFIALLPATLFSYQVKAQVAGTNQIGVRFGGFNGITYSHVGSRDLGVQIDLLENYHGTWTIISLMAEKHFPLGSGFDVYVGAGGFFGGQHQLFYEYVSPPYWDPSIGVEGVIGGSYYFNRLPLNLGFDVTPRFSFFNTPFPWDTGISVRYIF